ncbi:hypothetical protein DFH08DRAFT_720132 [Mycena albidolilacea]|uniref:Uncharacterized protein n=1 Tax=Mycena albidolilacea TaxID=1033008 RepID=A0AAD7EAJ8_9AGAR|nr:hypothetical protein DFH08DRAFT_720132 [Mycena albidolilacea]
MKSTTFAALLVLATGAIARNCIPHLDYCGRTLLEIGNYQPQIDQALHDAGAGEANGGADDRFHCVGGAKGVITFLGFCTNGCRTNPTGVSDVCN